MNYLVVGLGNIGKEYAHTRHNLGFMVLDAWAQASNILFEPGRYGSVATVSYKGRKIHLLKPSTYMNLSGNAVRYWIQKIKLPLSNVVIICDDLNLPFGSVRMRLQGSDGGHNGLKSIEQCLGTKRFARIRISAFTCVRTALSNAADGAGRMTPSISFDNERHDAHSSKCLRTASVISPPSTSMSSTSLQFILFSPV